MERDDTALSLGPFESLLALERLLPPHLILVKLSEIVDDDGDGQGNDQYSANAADASDNLPEGCDRIDITVADRRHGNSGPPEGFRNAGVLGTRFVFLGEIAKRRKDEHAHGQEEHQQTEFLVGIA